jgi:hypothetical protein
MTNDIHLLKSDNDECRVLAFSNRQLPDYRRAMEEAITALLSAYGMTCGEPYKLTAEQSENLKRLHRLRMALHEGY